MSVRVRCRDEAGIALVEIVIALVVIGLVVTAYFATFTTSAQVSKQHRDLVRADEVLRDYAEAVKRAVRDDCIDPQTRAPRPGAQITPEYSPPPGSGFTVSATGLACPSVTETGTVLITASHRDVQPPPLTIEVRTP